MMTPRERDKLDFMIGFNLTTMEEIAHVREEIGGDWDRALDKICEGATGFTDVYSWLTNDVWSDQFEGL